MRRYGRGQLKCDGTRAETTFRLSAKRASPFKSAGMSVQCTGSWVVCISCSNAGYTMFRGSVKSTGYTLHSPVSPSLPLPCVTVCHHISARVYHNARYQKHKESGVMHLTILQTVVLPDVTGFQGSSRRVIFWNATLRRNFGEACCLPLQGPGDKEEYHTATLWNSQRFGAAVLSWPFTYILCPG